MLQTSIASIKLENCIYNASGPRTGSSATMSKIASSESGAILAKSATLKSQSGNPLPRTWHSPSTETDISASLNSEGLPNSGIDYYIQDSTINDTLRDSGDKPYMVSISGKTLEDNLTMITRIFERKKEGAKIAAVELNLACPNIIGKPIIAYDFSQMETVLEEVSNLYQKHQSQSMPLGVKMPPYFDALHFQSAATILNKYKHCVKFVTSINTVGNAFAVDFHSEMPVMSSNGGFAGLSGPAIKFIALANVCKLRQLLDPSIDVVGVGGIRSGKDAFEMILCGASAVQVGTCHWTEGPKCFERISNELKAIMNKKGYSTIEDFRGKMKEWSKEGAARSRLARKAEKKVDEPIEFHLQNKTKVFMAYTVVFVVAGYLLNDKYQIFETDLNDDNVYMTTTAILLITLISLLGK